MGYDAVVNRSTDSPGRRWRIAAALTLAFAVVSVMTLLQRDWIAFAVFTGLLVVVAWRARGDLMSPRDRRGTET
jgi:putative copper export protein